MVAQLAVDRERGVFLADRAVGADREQALAGAFATRTYGKRASRLTDIVQPDTRAACGSRDGCDVGETLVHSCGYVEACFDRREQRSHPGPRNVAATVGDADDHRPRAPRARLDRRQVRKPEVDASR